MGALDAPMAAVVKEVLDSLGTTCTLSKENNGFDPLTDTDTPSADTTTAAVRSTGPLKYSHRQVDGKLILHNDLYVIVENSAALTLIPNKEATKLTVGGTTFNIVSAMPIIPADTTIAYRVQLRY